jgi:hypothetical protein
MSKLDSGVVRELGDVKVVFIEDPFGLTVYVPQLRGEDPLCTIDTWHLSGEGQAEDAVINTDLPLSKPRLEPHVMVIIHDPDDPENDPLGYVRCTAKTSIYDPIV